MGALLRVIVGLCAASCLASSASAAIITNAPRSIDKRVTVQPIVLANNNGSSQSYFFGNAPHQAEIEGMVDKIWSQAGIDIEWLTPKVWKKTQYLHFSGTVAPMMYSAARAEGVATPAGSKVVNAFFFRSVDGYTPPSNRAVGMAYFDANGTFQALGSQTVSTQINYQVAARLVAHELGHNLGLEHTANNNLTNLMLANDPNSSADERLTGSQINAVRSSSLLTPYTPPGDFNGDGAIDSGDLSIWENGFGGSGSTGDADDDGDADGADFLVLQRNMQPSPLQATTLAVPEPSSWVLASAFLLGLNVRVRR